MVYTMFFNGNEFTVAEEDVLIRQAKPPKDYGNIEVSHFKEKACAQAACDMNNQKIASGEIKMIKCRDCKLWFLLTDKNQNFYIEKGLKLPSRCKKCRQKRKAKATQEKEAK